MSRRGVQGPKAKIRCKHCGATTEILMQKYSVGEELLPYSGGDNYGICFRCKKTGMIVISVPQYPPTPPAGWARIPGQ